MRFVLATASVLFLSLAALSAPPKPAQFPNPPQFPSAPPSAPELTVVAPPAPPVGQWGTICENGVCRPVRTGSLQTFGSAPTTVAPAPQAGACATGTCGGSTATAGVVFARTPKLRIFGGPGLFRRCH